MARRTNAAKFGIEADNELAPYITKAGNYLLRSSRAKTLRRLMALAHAGRVGTSGHGLPCMFKADGTWAGSCGWEVGLLEQRGLLVREGHGKSAYKVTRKGALSLEAALRYLGEVLDTDQVCAELDRVRIW